MLFRSQAIIKRFREADIVDRVIYQYAQKWDAKNLDLKRFPPQVMHAQRGASDLRPVRLNVLDSNIKATAVGDVPFSAANVLVPAVAVANAQLTIDLLGRNSPSFTSPGMSWDCFDNLPISFFEELLRWRCLGEKDIAKLSAAATTFDIELQEAGLSRLPKVFAVRGRSFIERIANMENPQEWFDGSLDEDTAFRSLREASRPLLRSVSAPVARQNWLDQLENVDGPTPSWMLMGEMEYVGDPQRRLRDSVSNSGIGPCAMFMVEPVFVYSAPRRDGGEVIGLGMELAIMAPKGYSLSSWTVIE